MYLEGVFKYFSTYITYIYIITCRIINQQLPIFALNKSFIEMYFKKYFEIYFKKYFEIYFKIIRSILYLNAFENCI